MSGNSLGIPIILSIECKIFRIKNKKFLENLPLAKIP
jgi:hypothetical protein